MQHDVRITYEAFWVNWSPSLMIDGLAKAWWERMASQLNQDYITRSEMVQHKQRMHDNEVRMREIESQILHHKSPAILTQ